MYLLVLPLVINKKVTDAISDAISDAKAISFVHKDAVVGFGDYDYDYHDDNIEKKTEQQESKDDTKTYSDTTKSSKIKDEKVLKDDFSFFLGKILDKFEYTKFLFLKVYICAKNFKYISNN